jgi:hypothetical protein
MTITTWSPALAPSTRPDDDEPPLCLSTLYVPQGGVYVGPLVCIYDAGHPVSGGPLSRHCGGSALFTHHWSDAEAVASLAEHRASALIGPVCSDCEARPQSIGGRCWHCAADELARDGIETESEAA